MKKGSEKTTQNLFDELGNLLEEDDTPVSEEEYYTLDNIKKFRAQYNMIFGKRSNGKTYAVLYEIVKNYFEKGKQGAYLRRYREDFVGKRGAALFSSLSSSGAIKEITGGKWETVKYSSSQWFLARKNPKDDKLITDSVPFCYGFSLASMEHDKSTSYPDITTVVFDEFISRIGYLNNEFVLFMNTLSTIIRQRDDVTIYMLGNTVNKYCPYFAEMGLGHIESMEAGKIDIYSYGESKLRVAVERTKNHNIGGRKSEIYFAFDNPNLEMITGGAWELDLHPHSPRHHERENVVFNFFLRFNDQLLQGDVVEFEDCCYVYFHVKDTPIRHPERDLIISSEYDPRPNYVRNIKKSTNVACKRIMDFFRNERVYYQNNDVGEIVRNYLIECGS